MSKLFYHVMQDNVGNLLFDVSGTMRLAGSGTLATIYGDEALTVILPNPMTNHPSFASFKCFLGAGDYDFYLAKAGYTFETLTGVQGHGTMAQQDAANVAITGGSANLGPVATPLFALVVDADGLFRGKLGVGNQQPGSDTLVVNGTTRLYGTLGVGIFPPPNASVGLAYDKSTKHGLTITPSGADAGVGAPIVFNNVAGGTVGSIQTTATATAYNTTSDSRLKTAVDALTGELALIQALRPVSFRWLADDSPGVGFLASEVAAHVQGVITGEPDAVDETGGIIPQMIDMSKLVPFLVGALQTLAARLVVLEDALGV